MSSRKGLKSGIDLNTREDTDVLKALNERSSVGVTLKKGLLVENSTRDVFSEVGSGEEETYVRSRKVKQG